jgi:hypothetical protein
MGAQVCSCQSKSKSKDSRQHTPQSHPLQATPCVTAFKLCVLRWELAGEPEQGSSQRKPAPSAAATSGTLAQREWGRLRRAEAPRPAHHKHRQGGQARAYAGTHCLQPCWNSQGTGAVEGRQQKGETPDTKQGPALVAQAGAEGPRRQQRVPRARGRHFQSAMHPAKARELPSKPAGGGCGRGRRAASASAQGACGGGARCQGRGARAAASPGPRAAHGARPQQ